MTVVIAIRCDDGIVVGADTQINESDRGMSYPARKLHLLGEHAAWGGSGARAVLTDTKAAFDEAAAAILESTDVGREMQEHPAAIYLWNLVSTYGVNRDLTGWRPRGDEYVIPVQAPTTGE